MRALHAVLVLEPVRDHLELQLADRAEQQHRAGDRAEHLDRALLAELRQAGLQLLGAQRVGDFDAAEHLGREERQAGVLQRLAFGERVAELQHAVVGDADDVAGEGLVEQLAALRQEATTVFGRSSLPERTTFSRMPRSKWPLATRTKAMRSRCAGSMLAWILNTTPLNLASSGCTDALHRRARRPAAAPGRPARRAPRCTPKLLTAEPKNIGVCRPARKASRSNGGAASRSSSISPCGLLVLHAEALGVGRVVEAVRGSRRRRGARSSPGAEHAHLLLAQVHHAVEALAHADRPGEGHDLHAELALDLVHQRQRLLDLAVHLVDEGQDRRVARAADLQQPPRLRLDAVGRVDHHQRRVDRGQHAVGVFARSPGGRACRAG